MFRKIKKGRTEQRAHDGGPVGMNKRKLVPFEFHEGLPRPVGAPSIRTRVDER